nr:hypothetical protein [Tanacetum cinerariifolium]
MGLRIQGFKARIVAKGRWKSFGGVYEGSARMGDKEVMKVLVRCLVGCLVISWRCLRCLRGAKEDQESEEESLRSELKPRRRKKEVLKLLLGVRNHKPSFDPFLNHPGVPVGQAVQTIILNNDAFQTEDLDTYDSDCGDISNAKSGSHGQHKAQRIKPTLYDGIIISNKHVAMPVIDDEKTLILEERSRSKMSKKRKDPEVIKKKISYKPIDYEKLNRRSEDFGKHFTPQQEMDAEQTLWFCISNPAIESYNPPPVKVEVPSELPKVSLVNASLKKLKVHLTQFDSVVKKRTTLDARTEVLVDKQCLGSAKKEVLLENDRLLQQIMSQDALLTVINSMFFIDESVNMERKRNKSYDKCFNLDADIFEITKCA